MQFFIQRPALKFLSFFVPGILVSGLFQDNSFFVFTLLCLCTVFLFTRWYNGTIPVLFFCTGILNPIVFNTLPEFNPNLEKTEKDFTCVVKKINQRFNNVEYNLELISEDNVHALIRKKDSLNVEPGDTLFINGILKKPHAGRNPGAFNYRKFLKNKGIHWLFSAKSKIIRISIGEINFNRICFRIRENVQTQFTKFIDKPYAGTLMALLFGEKAELELNVLERFRVLGIVHILAVSGLHVGFIFIILNLFAKIIRMTSGWRTVFISSGLFLYMGVTGFPDSVVRAGILGILYLFGSYRQKKTDIWNLLGWGALVMLFLDSKSLYNVGFQLSFGAVAGIIYVYNQYSNFADNNHILNNHGWIKYLADGIVVSLGALFGTFLAVAIHFHEMPLIGPVVNLIALPLTFLIIIAGVLTAISGFILPSAAEVYGNAAFGLGWFLDTTTARLYELNIPVFLFGGWTLFEIISVFGCLIILFTLSQKRYIFRSILSVLFVWNIFFWGDIFEKQQARITFLDVGQGDACVIETKGKAILIDAGYAGFGLDVGRTVLLPFLKYRGINQIDLAVLSHPHADHIGGFQYLADRIKITDVWDTKNRFESKMYQRLINQFEYDETEINYPNPGDNYKIGDVTFKILYPDSMLAASAKNINEASLILKMEHHTNSVLFLGDGERSAENFLMNMPMQVDADIIKVGHHGSKTSSIPGLVETSTADIAVISVGEGNKFSHPDKDVLRRWRMSGAAVFRTDIHGAVTLISEKEGYWIYTQE